MPSQPPPTLTNPQLLTALSHPTRAELLKILSERTETPKNLALELKCPIRHVSYHLEVLKNLGCVELKETEISPGGRVIAHHYRALKRFWFDREAWRSIDPTRQPAITMDILRLMGEDLTQALQGGTIDSGENHISRTPAALDQTGYEELIELLNETLEKVVEIQAESANRLENDSEPIFTKVHLVQFISPDPNK